VCDKQPSLEDCPSHLTLDLNGISTDLEMNTFLKTRKPCVSQPNRGRKRLQSALFCTQRSHQRSAMFVCFLGFMGISVSFVMKLLTALNAINSVERSLQEISSLVLNARM